MIAVKDLTPGLILSHPVITPDGKVLLGEGGTVTPRAIALLTMWDINYVHIHSTEELEDAAIEIPVTTSDAANISVECAKFFQEYDNLVTSASSSFDFVRNQKQIPVLEIKETSFIIYSSILTTGPAIMDYLLISDQQLADDISRHSVMVAYICGLIGRQMKLTPDEIMISVLQHHESLDGTGFPMGVKGNKIHLYAKIIAIANIFHNETYKGDHCNPFLALNILADNITFAKIDAQIAQPFIQQIRTSLLHCNVLLSDGRQAEIFYFPPSNSNAPIVQTTDNQLIDLSTSPHITIKRLCTPGYLAG
jgi:HD-GYP domain-containing protein (c-di-GMP phosphodiesterase class II)